MSGERLPAEITAASRLLTAAEFHRLAEVPPDVEWFANLTNPSTRRAYENAVGDFVRIAGITTPAEFRIGTRAHIIRWRDGLVGRGRRIARLSRWRSDTSRRLPYHFLRAGNENPYIASGEARAFAELDARN